MATSFKTIATKKATSKPSKETITRPSASSLPIPGRPAKVQSAPVKYTGPKPVPPPAWAVTKGQPLPASATVAKGQSATPTPSPTPNTAVAPFLTPQQQLDQINFDSGLDAQVQALGDAIRNAGVDTAQGLIDAQRAHDVNTAAANESAAARGLFQSSIRAGDLNDIDATLVTRQNTLNTALQNLTISNNTAAGRLITQRGTGDNQYLQMAIQNAQAQVPVLPPASTATHTTPNPTAPAPGAPPPPPEQQITTHPILPPGAQAPHTTDPFAAPKPNAQAPHVADPFATPKPKSQGFSSTVKAVGPPKGNH